MLRCKTCNEERTNEYFYGTGRNGKIYYVTNKCKLCRGIKVRDKFSHTPVRIEGDYDKRLLYLFLLRMKLTKGQATGIDVMNLEICYTQIYGDSMPEFTDRSDGLIYMYEKLKEFDCGLDNSGGGGKIKRSVGRPKKEIVERPMKRRGRPVVFSDEENKIRKKIQRQTHYNKNKEKLKDYQREYHREKRKNEDQ